MNGTSKNTPRLLKLLVVGLLLLLLNSSYLAAYGEPSGFYIGNLLFHIGLGIVLTALFLAFMKNRWSGFTSLGKLASGLLLSSASFGFYIVVFSSIAPFIGPLRTQKWAALGHLITGGLGVVVLAVALLRASLPTSLSGRIIRFASGAVLIGLFLPFGLAAYQKQQRYARDYIVNPTTPPLAMEGEGAGPQSPFFPSSANTNVNGIIPANFFMTSEACARCHKDLYDEWNSSMHHFSSFNNQWYRKSIEYMQDVVGTKPSKWCAGCHDHAVFFNGRFDKPIKEQINTPEAQNGLGCTSCHSVVHVRSTMGQGDFEIEYPPLHDLAASENRFLRWAHDFVTYADSEPHKRAFLKPFHREDVAEFCSSCHKVHLDKPVNNYRWFRGFNEYDNWQASGVSGQGARSFYYPPKSQTCADCHMPLVPSKDPAAKNGLIRSHRFAAANTAVPTANRDQKQLEEVVKFLKSRQVTVDIFGMTKGEVGEVKEGRRTAEEPRLASTFAVGEESMNFGASQFFITKPAEVIAPLNEVRDAAVRRGDSMRLEVVVRTRGVGHFFPGGTVDGFDVWVELQAVDNNGKIIYWSGMAEDEGKGPVEKGAHFYRSLMLDERGNPINKRNAFAARTVAYVRLIPPGAADTIHYRLDIPPDCGDEITIKAKVNYRKFAWWNTQWAYAGVRDPRHKDYSVTANHDDGQWVFTGDTTKVSGQVKTVPNLPIVTMAEDTVKMKVIARDAPLPEMKAVLNQQVRERWNDYGIGLLLQGDLKGAEAAFLKVTEMDPGYADGWVNVARARIQEGELTAAAEMLQKAFAVNPSLAKTHFFYALALKADGKYDEAIQHLQTAAAQYPRDRVVQNTIGRIYFLQRKYQEAIATFGKVLAVDPEDLQAHYNLMLCYQGMGNTELAQREETLYKRFKADESAQAITGPYRQLHPDDNNERQQIHEHHSVKFDAAGRPQKPAGYVAAAKTKPRSQTAVRQHKPPTGAHTE